MTNKEILQKAIEKAVKGGWRDERFLHLHDGLPVTVNGKYLVSKRDIEAIIFSHDFAKAFWGEGELNLPGKEYHVPYTSLEYVPGKKKNDPPILITFDVVYPIQIKAYIYHLHRMVEAKEPLKYLESYL